MSTSIHNLDTLKEAAITLLREVESLASQQEPAPARDGAGAARELEDRSGVSRRCTVIGLNVGRPGAASA